MSALTHEGGGGGVEEEKTTDSGKRAEGQVSAHVHGGDFGHGGEPGDEKKEEELGWPIDGRATFSGEVDLEEGTFEEDGASPDGMATSVHGDGQAEAKEADPGSKPIRVGCVTEAAGFDICCCSSRKD